MNARRPFVSCFQASDIRSSYSLDIFIYLVHISFPGLSWALSRVGPAGSAVNRRSSLIGCSRVPIRLVYANGGQGVWLHGGDRPRGTLYLLGKLEWSDSCAGVEMKPCGLKQIQDTLSSLSKAVERLSKGNLIQKHLPQSTPKAKSGGKQTATPSHLLGSCRVQVTQPQSRGGPGPLGFPRWKLAPVGEHLQSPKQEIG